MRNFLAALVIFLSVLCLSCSDDDSKPTPDVGLDAVVEASVDAVSPGETSPETAPADAGLDAAPAEAGVDGSGSD